MQMQFRSGMLTKGASPFTPTTKQAYRPTHI